MDHNKININANGNDIDYTIVLGKGELFPPGDELQSAHTIEDAVSEQTGKQFAEPGSGAKEPEDGSAGDAADNKAAMDLLYAEYEQMFKDDPTVLDDDDIYPHSYHWRVDRYDQGKKEVLEEAVRRQIRIAETEAYQVYVDGIKALKFTAVSWD